MSHDMKLNTILTSNALLATLAHKFGQIGLLHSPQNSVSNFFRDVLFIREHTSDAKLANRERARETSSSRLTLSSPNDDGGNVVMMMMSKMHICEGVGHYFR